MVKRNRRSKKSSSGSESDSNLNPKKQTKIGGPAKGSTSDIADIADVSDLWSQSFAILYDSKEVYTDTSVDTLSNDLLLFDSIDQTCISRANSPVQKTQSVERVLGGVSSDLDSAILSLTDEEVTDSIMSKQTGSSSNTKAKGCTSHSTSAETVAGAVLNSSDSDKLKFIVDTVVEIKRSQDGMRKMIDSKFDKLREEMKESIDTKIRALRDELSTDMARESNRLDQVMTTIHSMQLRMETMEKTARQNNGDQSRDPSGPRSNHLNDPDLTITASGIPVTENEDLLQKAEELIQTLGDDVASNVLITGATRLPTRLTNRPGLVKISFQNVDEKILVLRNKMNLKDTTSYKNVYLKSDKSRIERLVEFNARTILRNLPHGRSYRVNANGRIITRAMQNEHSASQNNEEMA